MLKMMEKSTGKVIWSIWFWSISSVLSSRGLETLTWGIAGNPEEKLTTGGVSVPNWKIRYRLVHGFSNSLPITNIDGSSGPQAHSSQEGKAIWCMTQMLLPGHTIMNPVPLAIYHFYKTFWCMTQQTIWIAGWCNPEVASGLYTILPYHCLVMMGLWPTKIGS